LTSEICYLITKLPEDFSRGPSSSPTSCSTPAKPPTAVAGHLLGPPGFVRVSSFLRCRLRATADAPPHSSPCRSPPPSDFPTPSSLQSKLKVRLRRLPLLPITRTTSLLSSPTERPSPSPHFLSFSFLCPQKLFPSLHFL
ncbi:hypothetical protein LINPERPRIM_LOCUS19729, partial [Linum perenne]